MIFGIMLVANDFRIRFNSEQYKLLNDIDFVQCINNQRLSWFCHVVRMGKETPARCVFHAGIRGSGQPCLRWKKQFQEALLSIGVNSWFRRLRRMCYDRPKSINRFVDGQLSKVSNTVFRQAFLLIQYSFICKQYFFCSDREYQYFFFLTDGKQNS